MELARDAKRKVMQELLELAKGQLGETLRAKKPKGKPPEAVAVEVKEECPDCKDGDCEEHDGEGYKAKLTSVLEQLTGDDEE